MKMKKKKIKNTTFERGTNKIYSSNKNEYFRFYLDRNILAIKSNQNDYTNRMPMNKHVKGCLFERQN